MTDKEIIPSCISLGKKESLEVSIHPVDIHPSRATLTAGSDCSGSCTGER